MAYTKEQTINELKSALSSIEILYNAKCINWTGTTSDTKELYTEVIAGKLLRNLKKIEGIKSVTRTGSYCRDNHNKIEIDLESNRKEEIFAKRIAYLNLGELGEIKDYQIPLKDTQADKGLGKIDLISLNEDSETLYLIELKFQGNNETLLRATLESYTYSKIIDQRKLINDCFNNQKFVLNKIFNAKNPDEIKVKPAVLLVPDCRAFKELEELELGERPKLKALALALDIKYFILELITDEILL